MLVGEFEGDLVVERQVIVELKAVQEHHDRFTAQCLNYLKATGLPVCSLLNFGKPQLDIKQYAHPSSSNVTIAVALSVCICVNPWLR